MNLNPDDYRSLTEIYEIGANIVEVVRPADPPAVARTFRVTARRVLRGSTAYAYLARIEELIDLSPSVGREAQVWRDVTPHFTTASGGTADECIDLALLVIDHLSGSAHVFKDPAF